jgi:hypothetical protein
MGVFGDWAGESLFEKKLSPVTLQKIHWVGRPSSPVPACAQRRIDRG